MPNIIWTDAEKAFIKAERAKTPPTPVPQIAAALNRKVPATYNRCRMINALVQPHARWTDEHVALLKSLIAANPAIRDVALAGKVGHSADSVRWKVEALGIADQRQLACTRNMQAAVKPKIVKKPKVKAVKPATPKLTKTPTPLAAPILPTPPKAPIKIARGSSAPAPVPAPIQATKPEKPVDVTKLYRKTIDMKPRPKVLAAKTPRVAIIRVKAATLDIAKPTPEKIARPAKTVRAIAAPKRVNAPIVATVAASKLAHGSAAPAKATKTAVNKTAAIVITLAPRIIEPIAPAVTKTSGRGGWTTTFNPKNAAAVKRKATVDAAALSMAASDAVAQFIAERGVTRPAMSESEAVIAAMQRRGYIVVSVAADIWMIDHRTEIKGLRNLTDFAAKRGLTINQTQAA